MEFSIGSVLDGVICKFSGNYTYYIAYEALNGGFIIERARGAKYSDNGALPDGLVWKFLYNRKREEINLHGLLLQTYEEMGIGDDAGIGEKMRMSDEIKIKGMKIKKGIVGMEISGNSYRFKEEIKMCGGHWNKRESVWIIAYENLEKLLDSVR